MTCKENGELDFYLIYYNWKSRIKPVISTETLNVEKPVRLRYKRTNLYYLVSPPRIHPISTLK